MASKKKFEGTEVVVTAPRMRIDEQFWYDRDKEYSERTGTPMNQVPSIRRKERKETEDMASGLMGGPVNVVGKINLAKIPRVKKFAQDLASRLTGGADSIISPAKAKEKEEKIPDDWKYEGRNYRKGGMVKSRGNGIAQRGKTKGKMR